MKKVFAFDMGKASIGQLKYDHFCHCLLLSLLKIKMPNTKCIRQELFETFLL